MSPRRLVPILQALAVMMAWTAAAPAFGQYVPPEAQPPAGSERSPAPPVSEGAGTSPVEASADTLPKEGPRDKWGVLLILNGAWEDNVGFTTPAGPDDYFGSLRALLTRYHYTPKSEVSVSAEGSGYLYQEQTSQNRADGGASLRARSQLGRRTRGELNGSYTYGHTDSMAFVQSAVLLPLARAQTGFGRGGLTWQTSESTALSVEGGWSGYFFDTEGFLNTETWRGNASLARRQGPRATLDIRLELTHNRQSQTGGGGQEAIWDYPTLTLGYTAGISRGLSLEVRAGAGRSSEVTGGYADAPPDWGFSGLASLGGRIRRTSIRVAFSHNLEPTVGLGGRQRSSTLSLGLTVPLGRSFELLSLGAGSLRQDATNPAAGQDLDTDVFVGAAVRLVQQLRLVAGYRLRYRDWQTRSGVAWNNRASLSLVWGDPNR